MSESPSARPVSVAAFLAILACFALFLLVTWLAYRPQRLPAPQNAAAERLAADQAWKATPAARQAYLAELRARQSRQLESYGWVDRKAGLVQLPIDRAMDLIARKYATPSPSPQ